MNEYIKFILMLVKGTVLDEEVTEPSQSVNWNIVFTLAQRHNIVNVITYAVCKYKFQSVPENIKIKAVKLMNAEVLLDEAQRKAAKEIFQKFSCEKLDYMPQKGILLKEIFPNTMLRRMSDIDILTRMEKQEDYIKAMEELGFLYEGDSINEYTFKRGMVSVELHKYLLTPNNDDMLDYYGTGWDIAKKTGEYEYRLSREEEYIYLISHFAKHYRNAGVGLKPVIDIWLYKKKYELSMDYINEQLEKLNLLKFHNNLCDMIDVWFEGKELTDTTKFMTNYIFSSGEYGTEDNRKASTSIRENMDSKSEMGGKMNSYFKIIFLDFDSMKLKFPILEKFPVLLPFCWILRVFTTILFRKDKIAQQKENVDGGYNENANRFKKHIEMVGLDIYNGRKEK